MEQEKRLTRRNINGRWLVQLRAGIAGSLVPNNHYLLEAVELRALLYTLPELEQGFSSIFAGMPRPLVLDAGCYFGDTVVELAAFNPGIDVLGLDLKYKRVVKSCRKIKRAGLTNAKIAICDILDLLPILPEHSIDGICVFFPDPWRKNRHEKYRFLNRYFFKEMFTRLTDDGFIWFKTDHKDYFEEAAVAAVENNFTAVRHLPGNKIAERHYKTIFEELFHRQNLTTYEMIFKKVVKGR